MDQQQQQQMSEELTLKELILALAEYLRYFLRKWYWFLLGAVLIGGLFFYAAYTKSVYYSAPLTFLLNNDKEQSIGAGALLGSLGLSNSDKGGGKVAKLLELSKSRQVVGRVLFDSATVEGESRLIANHLINFYGYHEQWRENERLANFWFDVGQPRKEDHIGNQVFKSLYRRVIQEDEGVLSVSVDEVSGMLTLVAMTPKPELSIAIAEKAYAELTGYFVNASVSSKEESLRLLTLRADSVETALATMESRLARFQDRIAGIPLQQERIKGQQLQREVAILSTMYGEIIKNRETAAFLLENEKPGFELVDGPLQPLSANRVDWKRKVLIGITLGLLLTGILLFFSKLIFDAMRDD